MATIVVSGATKQLIVDQVNIVTLDDPAMIAPHYLALGLTGSDGIVSSLRFSNFVYMPLPGL